MFGTKKTGSVICIYVGTDGHGHGSDIANCMNKLQPAIKWYFGDVMLYHETQCVNLGIEPQELDVYNHLRMWGFTTLMVGWTSTNDCKGGGFRIA